MATMSDDGDKTCPLCAEEMDLTDQQLKPCKCGYEICVWCWHQIMDMAERENSEGRCPACRTTYDKVRIAGMAANCERLITENNTEKKYKTQKPKLRMSADAQKNLSRVRVVQRNLVYVMGMPSHLALESVLERKEFFGQYGKILKLSISRPTTTALHASSNCSNVYITYAREEDALQCIQSVHNYTLEGKSLRACFGTTKYCHSWLKNMTCGNPDCSYLHDISCHEDSFTKDEIISSYSRSRVPPVSLNNLQRRAGNVLPPPADDLGTNRTASSKTCLRMSSNNTSIHAKSANVSGGRPIILPAAASWGSRVPNKCPPTAIPCMLPVQKKPDVFNSTTASHSSVNVVAQSSLIISAWDDDATTKASDGRSIMHTVSQSWPQESLTENVCKDEMTSGLHKSTDIVFDEVCNYAWDDDVDATSNQVSDSSFSRMDGKASSLETLGCYSDRDSQTSLSEDTLVDDNLCTSGISCNSSQLSDILTGDKDGLAGHESLNLELVSAKDIECNDGLSNRTDSDDVISNRIAPMEDEDRLCLGISAVNFGSQPVVDRQSIDKFKVLSSNDFSNFGSGSSVIELCQNYPNKEEENITLVPSSHASVATDSHFCLGDLPGWTFNRQSEYPLTIVKGDNYSLVADDQEGKVSSSLPSCSLNPPKISCFSTISSCKENACDLRYSAVGNSLAIDVMDQRFFALRDHSSMPAVTPKKEQQVDYAIPREVFETPDERCTDSGQSYLVNSCDVATLKTDNLDAGERSIISNMLSLDFDPWDDSSQTYNNFAKFLEGMEKQGGSSTFSGSWKFRSNNQSRFSFARQENSANVSATCSLAASHVEKSSSSNQESFRGGCNNSILLNTIGDPSVVLNRGSLLSPNNSTGILRPSMLAPPGFSSPNRAPPPGFSSQERHEQGFSATSDCIFHGSLVPSQFELHSPRNAGDVEFIDPAILAVGKGVFPSQLNNSGLGLSSIIPSQFCTAEGNRIQSFMQHSIASHQHRIYSNKIAIGLPTMHDAYIPPRFPSQLNTSYSPYIQSQLITPSILNSQWSDWQNSFNGSGMGMAEIVKNERFGHDNPAPMKEEHKLRLPSFTQPFTRPPGMP